MPDIKIKTAKIKNIPLTGCDYFLYAFSKKMKNKNNLRRTSRLILSLDSKPQIKFLAEFIEKSDFINFMSKLDFKRYIPLTKPVWSKNGKNPVTVNEIDYNKSENLTRTDIYRNVIPKIKNQNQNFSFSLINYQNNKCDLVLTWNHSLIDAKGAELLLYHINKSFIQPDYKNDELLKTNIPSNNNSIYPIKSFFQKLIFARKSLPIISEAGKYPMASMAPLKIKNKDCSQSFYLMNFSDNETDTINNIETIKGKPSCKSLIMLTSAIIASYKLLKRRNVKIEPFYIPVPHNLRRCGAKTPIISNHVTFLFFRINPEDITSPVNVYENLNGQMLSQIKENIPISFINLIDFFKPVPLLITSNIFSGPSKGRLASFFFSDTGNCANILQNFLGAEINNISHIPPTCAPPGFTITFSQFKNNINSVLSYSEDCVDNSEIISFEKDFKDCLPEFLNK